VFLLYLGVGMTTYAWSYLFDYAAMRGHGAQATAQIINTERHETWDGVGSSGVSHAIALSWHDETGMTRQFGCIVISERFWTRISAGERLAVYRIPIWYLEDEPLARPVIADDIEEKEWMGIIGQVIALIGVLVAIVTVLRARRVRSYGL
jgi:hypothetical protein